MKRQCIFVASRPVRLWMVPLCLFVSSCAAPSAQSLIPDPFASAQSGAILESEEQFLVHVAGKPLTLLHESLEASLVFNEDGTASGTLVHDGGDPMTMDIEWEWENNAYCRSGTIGESETSRKCESVKLFPGVGVMLTYIDSDDPVEYWLFDERQ